MIRKLKNINFTSGKLKKQLAWYSLIIGILLMLVHGVYFVNSSNLNALRVKINDKKALQNTLISAKEIHTKITKEMNSKIKDIQIKDLDVRWLESLLESDSRIRNAEIYVDQLNYLNAEIDLRVPILRVLNQAEGEQYYLDADGEKVSVVANSPIRVAVVTGHIAAYHPGWRKIKGHTLHDIMLLGKKIRNEEFLTALVEQIDIDKSGNFQLVPKIGNRIKLGSLDNIDEKLENLKALFKKGYQKKNWETEKYDAVNLEWKDHYVFEPKDQNINS